MHDIITDIYITYNDDNQLKRIEGEPFKASPFFHFIDERKRKSRKEAFALKNHWAAFQTPFILCMNGEIPVKAFYTESEKDVITELINYLNE